MRGFGFDFINPGSRTQNASHWAELTKRRNFKMPLPPASVKAATPNEGLHMGFGLGLRILSAEAARVAGEVEQHISDCGGSLSAWYAGITDDPERRLFTEHNVSKQTGHWIYRKYSTDDIAREVEQHFLDKGCQGGPGGGDGTSKYVYAYKVTNSTVE